MAEKSKSNQEAKRRRILKEAAKEFVGKGYKGANINVIAERSGIGKGTIYLYFSSKAELFAEALRASNELWMEKAREIVDSSDDPLKSLKELLKLDVVLGVEHKELAQLWISSFFGDNRQFVGTAAEVLEEYAGLVEDLVGKCVEKGIFRNIDKRLAAFLLLGVNEITIAFYDTLLKGWGSAGEVYDSLQDMMLGGLIERE